MLNMIRMELFRMFKTKSLYVIWTIFAVLMIVTTALTAGEMDAYSLEDRQQNYEYAMEEQESGQVTAERHAPGGVPLRAGGGGP